MPRLVAIGETGVINTTAKTACVARKIGKSECDQGKTSWQQVIKQDCQRHDFPTDGYGRASVAGSSPAQSINSCTKQCVPASRTFLSARKYDLRIHPQKFLSPFGSIETPALHAFEFYIKLTAQHLGGAFNRQFFTTTLPQLMQDSSAVKHSVLALAGFHETFMFGEQSVHGQQQKVIALNHYNKSIQAVVQLHQYWGTDSKITVLITCLLFCAIENVQGHFKSSIKHIAAGLQLLEADSSGSPSLENTQSDLAICASMIRSLLTNLGTHAMIIDEIDIDLQTTQSLLQRSNLAASEPAFSTVEEALDRQSYMFNDAIAFLSWAHQMQQGPDFPSESLLQLHAELNQRYILWMRAFRRLVTTYSESKNVHEDSVRSAILLLQLNQRIINIIVTSPWDVLRETIDGHTDEFEAIVREATEFLEIESGHRDRYKTDNPKPCSHTASSTYTRSFSMIMGIVPALYFASTECRVRSIQDQALHLLKTCQRRESVWDSTIFAAIAERLMLIKRANAIRYWKQQGHAVAPAVAEHGGLEDIPLSARISDFRVDYYGADDVSRVSTISILGSRKESHYLVWNGAAEDGHYRPLEWTSEYGS